MSDSITLPGECPVGKHVPGIVHRTGGADARLVNRCGKCGREIVRYTEMSVLRVDPADPWMTEGQRAEYHRELDADELITESTGDERCPRRE